MIKRVIGLLFTIATLVVIAFAIMNWGEYRSMVFAKSADIAEQDDVVVVDSLAVDVAVDEVDSLATIISTPQP